MEKIKGYAYCYECNNLFDGLTPDWHCPECGSSRLMQGTVKSLIDALLKDKD